MTEAEGVEVLRRLGRMKAELLGLVGAVTLTAAEFGWWDWTEGQTRAVDTLIIAVLVLVARLDRGRADLNELARDHPDPTPT